MNWRMISQVLAIFAALVPFGPTACHRIVQKPTPEAPLPDGIAVRPALPHESMKERRYIESMALNFTEKEIDSIFVDGQGYINLYADWGYSSSSPSIGSPVSFPKNLQSPFYLRIYWVDRTWYECNKTSGETLSIPTYYIRKSKLIKVTTPLPPEPKAMLLIFRTNDRVKCEIFENASYALKRVEDLREQEPRP